jgi:hypothetical protein
MKRRFLNYRLFITAVLIVTFLLPVSRLKAQNGNPIPGYAYLGACDGHHFYISNAVVFGNQIAGHLAANAPAGGYICTIKTPQENSCIHALLTAAKGVSPVGQYDKPQNPWIGFTDAAVEGTWKWSSGEPVCYTNWDNGEPNNFVNDEDYGQMLSWNGKWNDWFNNTNPDGLNFPLPYIVEYGTKYTSCTGEEGCSHGYYKNHTADWGGCNTPSEKFFTVFSISNKRGLDQNMTLLKAMQIGGGGYVNLARQGTASLLNACHPDVDFPLTQGEVKAAVKQMFEVGNATLGAVNYNNVGDLAEKLDDLNNLGCPLNGKKSKEAPGSTSISLDQLGELTAVALQNPAAGNFNIIVRSGNTDKVTIQVVDVHGRLVDKLQNVQINQPVRFGEKYSSGIYMLNVLQGQSVKQLKLVKM